MKRNILLGLGALALTVAGCARLLSSRSKRKEKRPHEKPKYGDVVLYGIKEGRGIALYWDIQHMYDDTIDVHYGSCCGSVNDVELCRNMDDDDVLEVFIKAKVIGKECDCD